MKPTSKQLESIYCLLCQFKPFSKWNLPDTAHIVFSVTKTEDSYGTYCYDDGVHLITISSAKCSHIDTIIKTLAHEMVHMKRYKSKDWDKHDNTFKKFTKQISDEFGFDPNEL